MNDALVSAARSLILELLEPNGYLVMMVMTMVMMMRMMFMLLVMMPMDIALGRYVGAYVYSCVAMWHVSV